MKATGIVRKVDELGRIVLPMELRRILNIEEKDALEIFVEDNGIVLKKYLPDTERESVREGLLNLYSLTEEDRAEILSRAIKIIG